jgi:hypothetical protein
MATVTGTINVNTTNRPSRPGPRPACPGNVTALTVNAVVLGSASTASGTAADKVDLKHTKTYTPGRRADDDRPDQR